MTQYDLATLKTITANLSRELEEAKSGKKTSFSFILHELSSSPLVKDEESFQVLVFGGSVHLRALLRKERGRITLLKRESMQQHKFNTAEDFFKVVEEDIDPSVKVVALNLAYPLKPVFEDGRLDGILIEGTKENNFTGLEGKRMGKAIEERIKQKTERNFTVSVANDTACLLLSGFTDVAPDREIAAGIVGTGLNFAIFLDKTHLVNLEAANFDKFPQSEEGKIIDQASNKPGSALLEKEVSGAYLYQHFNTILKRDGFTYPPLSSTLELNQLQENKDSDEAEIAKALFTRSASLTACVVAGITAFKKKDMDFVMEGSLFWNASGYRRTVKELVMQLVPEFNTKFIKIEASPIFGAAKLVS